MAKQKKEVAIPVTKVVQGIRTKSTTNNPFEFTNISHKANEGTQTKSNKRLIKALLHSVGLTHSRKSTPIGLMN